MKKALKTFWNEIAVSASDPVKTKTFLKKPFRSGLRYLFWLLFCISVGITVMVCSMLSFMIPQINPFVASTTQEIRALYPANLVLTMEKGVLSTNATGPVIIEFPAKWLAVVKEAQESREDKNTYPPKAVFDHLMVIDTKASVSDFAKYHSAILVTDKMLVLPDDRTGGVRTVPFGTDKSMVVTQEKYTAMVDALQPALHSLPKFAIIATVILFFLLPFILSGIGWLGYLLYLVFASLVTLLLAKLMGRKHTYAEVYQLGLYALTLPLIYELISFWIPFLRFRFFFTLIYLVWMCIIFGSEKVTKTKRA